MDKARLARLRNRIARLETLGFNAGLNLVVIEDCRCGHARHPLAGCDRCDCQGYDPVWLIDFERGIASTHGQ
jgi:hypothetical protein